MGNNQPIHKRERTSDGSQRRSRAHSGENLPLPLSSTTVSTEDYPVQMKLKKNEESFDPSLDFLEGDEYPVVFKWNSHPARTVYLVGSWDNWKGKVPLVKSTSDFSTIINLNPGNIHNLI